MAGLARRRGPAHRRGACRIPPGTSARRRATLLPGSLPGDALHSQRGPDQAGRRRLALWAVAASWRGTPAAAAGDLPRRTRRRRPGTQPRPALPAPAGQHRQRGSRRPQRPPLPAGHPATRPRPPRRGLPTRSDRLQPRLRATAAAPVDHHSGAARAGLRPLLLPVARDHRQRRQRACAQGPARALRQPAAAWRARGLPRTGEERLPPERGRPEHYAGNRRLRSRGRIAGHVRAQAPLRRRYAFGSLPDRRAHGEPVAGGARAVPGVSRLPGGRGLDPAPCRSARQPLLEPDRGRPGGNVRSLHSLRAAVAVRLDRWRLASTRSGGQGPACAAGGAGDGAETWTPSRSRCGASCCGYPPSRAWHAFSN